MSRKIIIAIDSFKGCLSSQEAGEAAARGVRQACPDCQVKVLPVADGGEGTVGSIGERHRREPRQVPRAHGPLMEPRDTCYGLSGDGRTAFIEMARISGLPLVPEGLRNPLLTTTYGTGELIADALLRGACGVSSSDWAEAPRMMPDWACSRHWVSAFWTGMEQTSGKGGQALARVERVDASGVKGRTPGSCLHRSLRCPQSPVWPGGGRFHLRPAERCHPGDGTNNWMQDSDISRKQSAGSSVRTFPPCRERARPAVWAEGCQPSCTRH